MMVGMRNLPTVNRLAYGLIAIAVFVLIGGAVLLFWPSKIEVRGSLLLGGDTYEYKGACQGDGGYSDIDEGAKVLVRDNDGTLLAAGRLGAGESSVEHPSICTFPFAVENVPGGEGYPYTVEVSSRGEIPFEKDDASSVVLTLGP